MTDEKKAPELGAVSNEKFLEGVFGDSHKGNILVHSFIGNPSDEGRTWPAEVWRGQNLSARANNYFSLSTFPDYRRQRNLALQTYGLMLDDIIFNENAEHSGGKKPRSALRGLKPTGAVETSPNQGQVFLLFVEPLEDGIIANNLVNGIYDALGYGDGKGLNRWCKLPVGANGKPSRAGFKNRLAVWEPDRRYTPRELADWFGLDWDAVCSPPPLRSGSEVDDDRMQRLVDFLGSRGMILEHRGDRIDIKCPWSISAGHSDLTGSCLGLPGSDEAAGPYWYSCKHDGCQHIEGRADPRRLNDLVRWARAEGAQLEPDAFEEFGVVPGAEGVEEPPPEKKLSLFSPDTLDPETEPPHQLVEEFLLVGEVSLVSAQPNTGKSAMALDLGAHVSAGLQWQGKEVDPVPVLYLPAESPGSIDTRMRALKRYMPEGVDLSHLVAVRERIVLTTPEDRVTFGKWFMPLVRRQGSRIAILDTLRSATPGLDENSNQDMGAVVQFLHELARRLNIHIMIIHHTTKAGHTASGGGTLLAQVDTEILIRDTDDRGEPLGHIELIVKQQRSLSTKNSKLYYRVVSVETGRLTNFNKPETAPMVQWISEADLVVEEMEAAAAEQEAQERTLEADIDRLVEAIRNGATHRWQRMEQTGLSEREERTVRQAAVDRGRLRTEGEGNGTRYFAID